MPQRKYAITLNKGLACFASGEFQAAEALVQTCIEENPEDGDAIHLLGLVKFKLGRLDEARKLIDLAIEKNPNNSFYYNNLAMVLEAVKNFESALDAARRAVKIAPADHEAQTTLGVMFQRCGKLEDAIRTNRVAISLKPDHYQAYINLGSATYAAADFKAAREAYGNALRIHPLSGSAAAGLGKAMISLGDLDNAKEILESNIDRKDCKETLRLTLADCYLRQQETNRAVELLKETVTLYPQSAPAWSNLAFALRDFSRSEEAQDALLQALKIEPTYKPAQENLAHVFLSRGQFEEGWKHYRHRAHQKTTAEIYPTAITNNWNPSELESCDLLTWTEQGLGDEILQASLIPDLTSAVRNLTVICSDRLEGLFRQSFPNATVLGRRSVLNAASDGRAYAAAPLIDTAVALRKKASDFPDTPGYLNAPSDSSQKIRRSFLETSQTDQDSPLLVGISWESSHALYGSRNSIPLEDWAPIFEAAKHCQRSIVFVSAQYGATKDYVEHISRSNSVPIVCDSSTDHSGDMRNTASQLAALDLVISTSTTTAQLAGALGLPTLHMTSYGLANGWYWMTDGPTTPWYPSMRLFRRDGSKSSQAQISSIAKALKYFASDT